MGLLLIGLIFNAVYLLLYFLRVTQIEVFLQLQLVVELKNVGYCRGDVEADNLLVAHALEGLDDAAQAVAVGHYEELVVLLEGGEDGAFIIGHQAGDGVLECLGHGQLFVGKLGIARIEARAAAAGVVKDEL